MSFIEVHNFTILQGRTESVSMNITRKLQIFLFRKVMWIYICKLGIGERYGYINIVEEFHYSWYVWTYHQELSAEEISLFRSIKHNNSSISSGCNVSSESWWGLRPYENSFLQLIQCEGSGRVWGKEKMKGRKMVSKF